MTADDLGFSTRAIHVGSEPDPTTGAVVPPIYAVSTYKQDGIGGLRSGYEYSRSANPTRTALEECLASLEGGAQGFAFASGLAGQDTVLRALLAPGDHVVVPSDAYGGTYRLFNRVARPWGVEHSIARVADVDSVRAAIRPGVTRMVWLETPTNPLLGIADISAIAEVAHAAGALLVVDNTFASPALQQPLALGADVVVHSTTKYINGHSDVVGGAVIAKERALHDQLTWWANALGLTGSPFDSFLTLRGLRTLDARLRVHQENATALAQLLDGHPAVAAVHFPGLASHPGHALAARQQRGFGAMISFDLDGGVDAVRAFLDGLQHFTLAESLGGVESLIAHPASMTHAAMSVEARAVAGISDGLLRLSVGIEAAEDLAADLSAALERATQVQPQRQAVSNVV